MYPRRRFLQIIGVMGTTLLLGGCELFEAAGPYSEQKIQEIHVSLKEWRLTLSSTSVNAGKVRFIVSNEGTMVHGFEIEGAGLEEEIDPFPAGQTRTLEVELDPGRYEVYCQVPGHKELGMEGELIVE